MGATPTLAVQSLFHPIDDNGHHGHGENEGSPRRPVQLYPSFPVSLHRLARHASKIEQVLPTCAV